MMARQQSKCWVFTLNNYVEGDHDLLKNLVEGNHAIADYIVFQAEIGDSGTPHYQGYLELKRRTDLVKLKRCLGPSLRQMHLERRRASQRRAIEYAKKTETREDGPWEFGEKHGIRAYEKASTAAIEGQSLKVIMEEHPDAYLRYHTGLMKMVESVAEERRWAMKIQIYYGKTGTGKSFTAHKIYPDAYHASWPGKSGQWWWPDYNGEETVIMDEFRHQVAMDELLKLFDRYPLKVQYKGGFAKFRSKRLVITTNIKPSKWFPKVRDVSMLRRRIQEFATIWEFTAISEYHDNGEPIVVRREIELGPREDWGDYDFSRVDYEANRI